MKQNADLQAKARQLRQHMTQAERILWSELRGRRFAGYKFRRQQIVGAYILDFYCSNAMLSIEIDGEPHLGKENPDERRSHWLNEQGIKVLRFWNTQVFDELEGVLESIFRECESRKNLRLSRRVDEE